MTDSHRPTSRSTPLGILTLLLTLATWSSTPLFLVHFAQSIDAWASNGWRYGFSALLWAPILLVYAYKGILPAGLWRAALWPAFFNAVGQMAFAASFYRVDAATATFGLRMQIVFVALGAWLLFPSERAVLRQPSAWAGIALVLTGVLGMVAAAPGTRPQVELTGVGLAVLAGVLFAGYGLAVRRQMGNYPSTLAFAAISQLTAAAMVLAMLVLGDATGPLRMPASELGFLALSAVLGIAVGHVFYYMAIARLGVAVTSGVLQLQPFVVATGSWLVLGKTLTHVQLGLGGVALLGAMLLIRAQVTQKPR